MASYATVPAEAEAEKPLLNRDVRVNLKTVIGGAAVASFVLGALAAAVDETGCWVGFWQSGPTVNTRSGARGSSLPASVEYTAPNYAFKTYDPSSITVTAFVDEKWYQSTFKLAICTAGC